MNKNFSLAGLMRVRALQEERAAAELAHANHLRHLADVERETAEQILAAQAFPESEENEELESGIFTLEDDVQTWKAVVAARASATAMLRESTQALAMAKTSADAAANEWAHAKMRAAMIEKLKSRHDQAVEAQELRDEQVVLDEAALRRSLEVKP